MKGYLMLLGMNLFCLLIGWLWMTVDKENYMAMSKFGGSSVAGLMLVPYLMGRTRIRQSVFLMSGRKFALIFMVFALGFLWFHSVNLANGVKWFSRPLTKDIHGFGIFSGIATGILPSFVFWLLCGIGLKKKAEQGGADQPATALDSELEDSQKSKPESEVRSQ